MNRYFLVKLKYEKVLPKKVVKVSENYFVEALSFTECEARINEEMQSNLKNFSFFEISNITPQKISEIFENESGEKWFKSKIAFVYLNDDDEEKKTVITVMANADDIKEARDLISDKMKVSLADWIIESISETNIIEIFKHKQKS